VKNSVTLPGARNVLLLLAAMLLAGCLGFPESVTPVQAFDTNRYLGNWYEIARLDHSFEEGLDRVTAEYSLREDGALSVINRGFLTAEKRWEEAQGKAYFVNGSDEGYLKVSFFGPFYGSYVVFELDEKDYQYAFVSGPDTSYLWFLSRTPKVDPGLIERFVARASSLGFDTSKLIFPEQ
jgi:apolipoprotein D and lipocalin family protein